MASSNPGPSGSELPPPPPHVIPQGTVPLSTPEIPKKTISRALIARRGIGTKGQKIPLLANHYKVALSKSDGHFYQYNVALFYEDGNAVDGKGIGRRVIDKVQDTYRTELEGKQFAYDGEKTLFTLGSLPRNKLEFTVVLEDVSLSRTGGNESPSDVDRKRLRHSYRSKTIKAEISYATRIPLNSIANALRGQDSDHFQEAIRVLDIILRQHSAKQGCLLVRQSFFHNNPRSFDELGNGVLGCRGFHSSFRATQGGLSLNIDVTTTMIIKPGPVVDFLLENQNVRHPNDIDWNKAKRMLKNLRIKTLHSNTDFKITGFSERPCNAQTFLLKQRSGENGDGGVDSIEITVYDYFVQRRNLKLNYSAEFPCINVGKPKKPSYFPIELCELVSLQRYTKALSTQQRSALVEKSRQKPQERMRALNDALKNSNYGCDSVLRSSGISISTQFSQVEGRVLPAPRLMVGNGENFFPRNGRWNFNNKKLINPVEIQRWAVVNFSARCDMRHLIPSLIKCGELKGIFVANPFGHVFEESQQNRRESASVRVEKMINILKEKLPGKPQLVLCILPERKNSDIYGPWKKKCLVDIGVVTQCIAPTKLNDQYLTNVLLKINAKLGGMNSLLTIEHSHSIPLVSKYPTLILGMDVSHGSPGRSDVPSIAAVVSSRSWPLISQYRASVRAQSPKVEMIADLFKPQSDKDDKGIIRESLLDFRNTSGRKPEQIIIFRDGVSESQFNQVLNIELDQIIQACKFLDESWSPKFMVIVAQKNHHTKFFQQQSSDINVPPGTVVDNKTCHPRNNDFYMCAHAGMIGTSRPTHYHVLYDEIGVSADDVQELVHLLSYVYQRSTTAISVVAPICYAHLAAAQMSQFVKFDELSDASSSYDGVTSESSISVPELPKLDEDVENSMFFC